MVLSPLLREIYIYNRSGGRHITGCYEVWLMKLIFYESSHLASLFGFEVIIGLFNQRGFSLVNLRLRVVVDYSAESRNLILGNSEYNLAAIWVCLSIFR